MARPPSAAITLQGLDAAEDLLKEVPKSIERARINALNRTATQVRKDMVDEIIAATGIKRKILNDSMKIKRATTLYQSSKITPSGAGIPVFEYKKRSMETVAPTRARIKVGWVEGGNKIAAGFINPLGQQKAALRTYVSYRGKIGKRFKWPIAAIGPSPAAMFRAMVNAERLSRYQQVLRDNYAETLAAQFAKLK